MPEHMSIAVSSAFSTSAVGTFSSFALPAGPDWTSDSSIGTRFSKMQLSCSYEQALRMCGLHAQMSEEESMTELPGPMRQVQIAHIATEYYLHGKTRIEIAEQTGLSRFKVGRLLDEAVESGIVRFEISSPSNVSLDLSVRLRERFGLDHAVVVAVPTDSEVTLQES